MLELPKTRAQGNMESPHIKQRKTSEVTTDIVKRGHLFIKRPPTNLKIRLKTWQKRLLVLRDDTRSNEARLEVYNTESNSFNKKTECFVVDLQQVPSIEEYKESKSFPHAFILIRKGQSPLVFGVETESEMREWIVALKLLAGKGGKTDSRPPRHPVVVGHRERRHSANPALESRHGDYVAAQSDIFEMFNSHRDRNCDRGHLVQVYPTKSSNDNNLLGNYMMRVTNTKIALRRTNAPDDVIAWPISQILKFKSEELGPEQIGDMVTLEAGLECHVAQGVFMFKTQSGKELVKGVREAVKKVGQKPSVEEELESLRSKLHPPRLPLGKCESVPNIPYKCRPSPPPGSDRISDTNEEDGSGGSLPEVIYNSYLQVIPDEEAEPEEDDSSFMADENAADTSQAAHPTESPCVVRRNMSVPGRESTQRKDSGFSETFEEPRNSGELVRRSISDGLPGTPPPPPPRPRHTLGSTSSNISSRPLPPLPPLPSSIP